MLRLRSFMSLGIVDLSCQPSGGVPCAVMHEGPLCNFISMSFEYPSTPNAPQAVLRICGSCASDSWSQVVLRCRDRSWTRMRRLWGYDLKVKERNDDGVGTWSLEHGVWHNGASD
eukprot:3781552-Amphidinium_carterae.1